MTVNMLRDIFEKTNEYNSMQTAESKKKKGQYFTGLRTAEFMSDMAIEEQNTELHILDPGAGNGVLGLSAMLRAIEKGCKQCTVTFYENDNECINLLRQSIELARKFCLEKGVIVEFVLKEENFILSNDENKYDIVISNPPYKKLRKDSNESKKMTEYVYGQPNLYALFMAKGMEMLRENGRFVYIVPRSWTSGVYYKNIRKALISEIDINQIHIFGSRNDAFSAESVLQETMIISGTKRKGQREHITITSSATGDMEVVSSLRVESGACIGMTEDSYIMIPATQHEADVLKDMSANESTLGKQGYRFCTGPVVEFRNSDTISIEPKDDYVPMLRSAHVTEGTFRFPVDVRKAQYVDRRNKKVVLRNSPTILIKRISAKEETRRLQMCVYTPDMINECSDMISIENHVNYLTHSDGSELTVNEVNRVFQILSQRKYDEYYRILNGSTQVNASELNLLPVPFNL